MTATDIFIVVVFISAIAGLLTLSASYVAVTGISALVNATANIPSYTPSSLFSNSISTVEFLPTASVILVIVMILFAWMLSAFIKASPLGAVISIAWLVIYTIAATFMSHYLISAARISVFTSMGTNANFIFLFWANMPIILIFATIIDIAIAMLALTR